MMEYRKGLTRAAIVGVKRGSSCSPNIGTIVIKKKKTGFFCFNERNGWLATLARQENPIKLVSIFLSF
jgi:hypothetical protein